MFLGLSLGLTGQRGAPGLSVIVSTPILQSATGTLATVALGDITFPATQNWADPLTSITWTITSAGALSASTLTPYAALPIGDRLDVTLRFVNTDGDPVAVRITLEGVATKVVEFSGAAASAQVTTTAPGDFWTADDNDGGVAYTIGAGVTNTEDAGVATTTFAGALGRVFEAGASSSDLFVRLGMEAGGLRVRIGAGIDDTIALTAFGYEYQYVRAVCAVSTDGAAAYVRLDDADGVSITRTYDISALTLPDVAWSDLFGGGLTRVSGTPINMRGLVVAITIRVRSSDGAALVLSSDAARFSVNKASVTSIASLDAFIAALPAARNQTPIALAASLTAGQWGAANLASVTTVAGAVTFSLEHGATPGGLTLDAASGLVHGAPSFTGASVARYAAVNPAGDIEIVEVTFAIASAFDAVTGGTLTCTATLADATPNNMTTDSNFITFVMDIQTGETNGSSSTLFEAGGRSQILVSSTGSLFVLLRNTANGLIVQRSISGFRDAFAGSVRRLHVVADTGTSTLDVYYDGVLQTWSGLGTYTPATIDHTRGAGYAIGRSITLGTSQIPSTWVLRSVYVNMSAALLPASFTTDALAGVGTPEILFQGAASVWNTPTPGGTPRVPASITWTDPSSWTVAVAGAAATGATALAMPGAVGHGRFATGGRGGTVRDVTGATPELRGADLIAKAALGGYVRLIDEGEYFVDDMVLPNANTTIDGRFAPGLGAWIQGSGVRVEGKSNVILHNLLIAPGSTRRGKNYNERRGISLSVDGGNAHNIYVAKCVSLWDGDENFSMWGDSAGSHTGENVTWVDCFCAESLAFPREDVSPYKTTGHPLQWIIGGPKDWTGVSVIGCASICGEERNILVNPSTGATVTMEVINSAFINPGNQGMVFSGAGDVEARMEASMFLAGPMTTANRELIFWDGPGSGSPLYLDTISAVWTYSGATLTKSVFVQNVTTEDNLLNLVRDATTNGLIYDATDWGDPNGVGVPARSNVTVASSIDDVYDSIRDNAGPTLRDGSRHPLVQRVLDYSMLSRTDSTLAAEPFTTTLGYYIGTKLSLIDELAMFGVSVTVGTGQLSITIPTGAMSSYAWTEYYVQVAEAVTPAIPGWVPAADYIQTTNANYRPSTAEQRCEINVTPTADTIFPAWSAPGAGDVATLGTAKVISGLSNATTYVIRVGFKSDAETVWLESGSLWRVT